MTRVIWAAAVLLSCASAIPDADSEAACRTIFSAWREAATACDTVAATPNEDSVCRLAYSHDEDNLNSCLSWLRARKCEEYHNAEFQAHCGKAIYLKTW